MEEEFKELELHGRVYRVGSYGTVFRYWNKHWVKSCLERVPTGYFRVNIRYYKKQLYKHVLLHRLVLFAFVGPPPSARHECMHLDHDKSNNRLSNLRWGTEKENMAMERGRRCYNRGEDNPNSILTERQVTEIRLKYRNGISAAELSRLYGTCETNVRKIVSKPRPNQGGWNHVS